MSNEVILLSHRLRCPLNGKETQRSKLWSFTPHLLLQLCFPLSLHFGNHVCNIINKETGQPFWLASSQTFSLWFWSSAEFIEFARSRSHTCGGFIGNLFGDILGFDGRHWLTGASLGQAASASGNSFLLLLLRTKRQNNGAPREPLPRSSSRRRHNTMEPNEADRQTNRRINS